MTMTFEAIYEKGVLRPTRPLPLRDLQLVQVTVEATSNWVQDTAGMIKWTGDHQTLRVLAEDIEFDPQETT